jgi:hypothetical protein
MIKPVYVVQAKTVSGDVFMQDLHMGDDSMSLDHTPSGFDYASTCTTTLDYGTVNYGNVMTLTPSPNANPVFATWCDADWGGVCWGGTNCMSMNAFVVTADDAGDAGARFARSKYTWSVGLLDRVLI